MSEETMNLEALKNFRSLGKKIVCVGRNFRAHALELGNPVPTTPVLFMKATSAYVTEGSPIKIPPGSSDLQQEVELAVVIGRKIGSGHRCEPMEAVGGYAVALDMTARDFQNEAKSKGLPWFVSKSFDTSCPISELIPKGQIEPNDVHLFCKINGNLQQKGHTDDMIFNVPTLIDYITQYVTLEPGDVILTGTPEGVCTVKEGDTIECGIENVMQMKFKVEK